MSLKKLLNPTIRRDLSLWIFIIGFLSSMGLVIITGLNWVSTLIFILSLISMISAYIHQQIFDVEDTMLGVGFRDY